MSQREDDLTFVPEQFSGRARLFPLPNLVLFPHVVQPLHIFEPRYVELLRDALDSDRMVTMALLDRGWETNYEGRPPIASVACLGRVVSWQAQADSRYNVLLLGLSRVRIVRELGAERAFRQAEVQLLPDDYPAACADERHDLRRRLIIAFEKMLPRIKDAQDLFNQLAVNSISLGTLTDVITYALDLDVHAKQSLLAQQNVDERARILLTQLTQSCAAEAECCVAGFPPAFSSN